MTRFLPLIRVRPYPRPNLLISLNSSLFQYLRHAPWSNLVAKVFIGLNSHDEGGNHERDRQQNCGQGERDSQI